MRSKGLADGQDPVTGADSQLHFCGEAALKTHPQVHLGGNEHTAFTSSNSNPAKKSLPAYYKEAKIKTLQWAERQ